MNKEKKLALQAVMLSMEEVKDNLQNDADPDTVVKNANAMKALAEAFQAVKNA